MHTYATNSRYRSTTAPIRRLIVPRDRYGLSQSVNRNASNLFQIGRQILFRESPRK